MIFQEFKNKYQKREVEQVPHNCPEDPLVSVCVLTFQHAAFIKQTLDSILAQELEEDFEILIGEDDSNDGTREICLQYARKYPNRIRLFLHHRENNIYINGSPTGRFNFLYNLYSAKGEYLCICEGDDYWIDNHKLHKQIKYLKENTYSICAHRIKTLDASGHYLSKGSEFLGRSSFKDLITHNYLYTSSVLMKRNYIIEGIGSWFIHFPVGDWPLTLIAAKRGDIYILDEVMSVYRIHSGGMWYGKKNIERLLLFFNNIRKLYDGLEIPLDANYYSFKERHIGAILTQTNKLSFRYLQFRWYQLLLHLNKVRKGL